jgi:hypothetical protein
MGKVKAWLMDMEEDAMWMSRDSWAGRHGSHNLDVFDKARDKYEGHIVEPDGPITCRPFSGSLKKEEDDES